MADIEDGRLTRRVVLSGTALGLALAAAATAVAGPKKKLSQAVAQYQDKPKGQARCINCKLFVSPDGCTDVVSPISPTGWCSLYVAKF